MAWKSCQGEQHAIDVTAFSLPTKGQFNTPYNEHPTKWFKHKFPPSIFLRSFIAEQPSEFFPSVSMSPLGSLYCLSRRNAGPPDDSNLLFDLNLSCPTKTLLLPKRPLERRPRRRHPVRSFCQCQRMLWCWFRLRDEFLLS